MTVAILTTAAALFGLQAFLDVESEKFGNVNELIQRLAKVVALAASMIPTDWFATVDEFAPLRA